MTLIRGSGGKGGGGGGGGGSSHTPTEADDTLQSVQFANVLDLLSEGEIEGIEDGEKGIYLSGTPVKDSSGNANYQGYTIVTRNGTQSQSYIQNLAGSELSKSVGVEVTKATPVVRQITDTDVDRVRVTLQIPALQTIEDDGDIVGNSVSIQLQVQYNGGGYSTVKTDTVSGKSSNAYQRDYVLTLSGAFPIDIKFLRTTDDNATAKNQNRTFWSSYTEIIDEKLAYPNAALTYLRFDSRQFQGIPDRKYLIRGIKVKLPSNASVDTTTHLGRVTYSGTWNGSFGAAQWCADPAWCLYDLMISTRYGASIPENSIDKWDFYAISQYCNELVSNGSGGEEPRFLCNLLINSRAEIYKVIQEMTSLFRGITYYAAGSLVLLQDKPSDSQYLIGPSNVIDGMFSYSGTSHKARHTTASVAWQSYEKLGDVEFEYVEDADGVSKYGVINREIKALGCYSQGQANRAGKWLLLSEQNLTETISFSVSIDSGIVLRPGMVIDVADPVKAGSRRSGRISSGSTTTAVVIDSATDLSVDMTNSPTISVILPTGLAETKDISSIAGTTVNVSGSFSQAPAEQGIWLIQTSDLLSQQYRVVTIKEGEENFAVTALIYNSSIYTSIETDLSLTPRDITNISVIPSPVSAISGTEFLYQEGQGVFSGFDLSWNSPRTAVNEFRVQYKIDNDNWKLITTTSPSVDIRRTRAGTLSIQIQAYNYLGRGSTISTASFDLLGKTAVPGNVQNLSFEAISPNSGRLRWDQTVDLDVKVGGKVKFRHSSDATGAATWSNSTSLIAAKSGAQTEAIVPLIEGEMLVKFVDDGGRESASATSVIVDLPDPLTTLGVATQREDQLSPTPFSGTKTDVTYDAGYSAIILEMLGFDGVSDVDAITDFDDVGWGDVDATGTYNFASKLDLGAIYSLDLKKHLKVVGYLPDDDLDARAALVDSWSDWDGATNNVDCKVYVRLTDNDPASGGASWGSWQELQNGVHKARGFDFKAVLTSADTDENIQVKELGYSASLQQRNDQSVAAVASGAGTKTITFSKPFWTGTSALGGVNAFLPSVGISANNMASGDYIQMGTVTGSQFQVTFKNSSGSSVDRNFTWSAVGYGLGP